MAESNFIDYVKIHCRSGAGGAGAVHFHRSKHNPMGGPDGGDGGRGGHIILRGNKQLWTLLHLKYCKHIRAGNGQKGGRNNKTGADGRDTIIEVPLGTLARDAATGQIIAEIEHDGQEIILARGGRGGKGNTFFKSATNQAPDYAQPGEAGEDGWKILELKLMADVGLVGFPNAGKSTLLSVLSAAKPQIADYPFTTLVPQLGMVPYHDNRSFILADIPGIIEGAHRGKGLGLRFLRHIERNSVLLFLIPADSASLQKEYQILLNELQQHNPDLLNKRRVIAISKCDLLDENLLEELRKTLPQDQLKENLSVPVVMISSLTGMGLEQLKDVLWQELNK